MAKRKQADSSGVPSGYVDTAGGSDGKAWQPKIGEVLQGVVIGKKTIDAKKAGRKKAKKGDTVTIVSVADKNGELHAVWESVGLKDFCAQARPKMSAFLKLLEVRKMGGGKTFKKFFAGLKK